MIGMTTAENELEVVKEAVVEWVRDAVSTHGGWDSYLAWVEERAKDLGWSACGVLSSQLAERLFSRGLTGVVDCVYSSVNVTDFVVYGRRRLFVRITHSALLRKLRVEVSEVVPRERIEV